MFDYDWFNGPPCAQQRIEAQRRCLARHFPDLELDEEEESEEVERLRSELETRMLIYLRDGFSYEIRQIANVSTKSHLVFECEPVDEQYKVGAFVVSVPFDEIMRVEVFSVHPAEKPSDWPQITGFRGYADASEQKHADTKPVRPVR